MRRSEYRNIIATLYIGTINYASGRLPVRMYYIIQGIKDSAREIVAREVMKLGARIQVGVKRQPGS